MGFVVGLGLKLKLARVKSIPRNVSVMLDNRWESAWHWAGGQDNDQEWGIWWFSQLLSGGELPGSHPPSHHWDRLQRRGGLHYLQIIPRLKFWIKSTYLSTQVNREKEKSRSWYWRQCILHNAQELCNIFPIISFLLITPLTVTQTFYHQEETAYLTLGQFAEAPFFSSSKWRLD